MKKVAAAMAVCALLPLAQANEDAMTLLKEAITTARATTKFRAEGMVNNEVSGAGMNLVGQPIHFKAAAESPLRTHRENSGDDHTQMTCDGAESLYTGDGGGFYRSKVQGGCTMSLAELMHVEESPTGATRIGHDEVKLVDGIHKCDLIRGDWTRAGGNGVTWRVVNTLCIEPERKLILRYASEANRGGTDLHSIERLMFTAIDLNPKYSAGLFAFSVPTGAMQHEGPQTGTEAPVVVDGVYRIGAGIEYPRVASKGRAWVHKGSPRCWCGRTCSGLCGCCGERLAERSEGCARDRTWVG